MENDLSLVGLLTSMFVSWQISVLRAIPEMVLDVRINCEKMCGLCSNDEI